MPRAGWIACLGLAPLLAAAGLRAQDPPPAAPSPILAAPAQPLPFSHRAHLAARLQCQQCHAVPDPGEKATLPAAATCMACHVQVRRTAPAIQQLREYANRGEPVPWAPVSRVPSFVIFSHREHLALDGVACADCHGPVPEMDAIQPMRDAWMDFCVACHEARGADTGCATCHDPR